MDAELPTSEGVWFSENDERAYHKIREGAEFRDVSRSKFLREAGNMRETYCGSGITIWGVVHWTGRLGPPLFSAGASDRQRRPARSCSSTATWSGMLPR